MRIPFRRLLACLAAPAIPLWIAVAGCDHRDLIEIVTHPGPFGDAGISSDSGLKDADSADGQDGAGASDAGLSPLFLGITANPRGDNPGGPTAGDTVQAQLMVVAAGARSMVMSRPWDALDDQAFDALKTEAAFYGQHGIQVLVNLAVVDRAADARPAALKPLAWNDPFTRAALEDAVASLLLSFGPELRAVTFGRDVDVYLAHNPSERAAFEALIVHGCAFTRSHPAAPADLQVGVGFSLGGAAAPDPSYADLLDASDIAVFSYLPGLGDPQAGLPGDVTSAADAMIAAASGKPIVLQALGYPTSPDVGGSSDKQQLFYTTLFGALAARRQAFSIVNIFQLHDLAPAACDAYAALQNEAPGSPLASYACSVGLFTADHVEKPAWAVVLQGSATFASP